MCLFREFNKLILPGIKFSVLIRNMTPPQGEWGGAFAPNAPSWIRHCIPCKNSLTVQKGTSMKVRQLKELISEVAKNEC